MSAVITTLCHVPVDIAKLEVTVVPCPDLKKLPDELVPKTILLLLYRFTIVGPLLKLDTLTQADMLTPVEPKFEKPVISILLVPLNTAASPNLPVV